MADPTPAPDHVRVVREALTVLAAHARDLLGTGAITLNEFDAGTSALPALAAIEAELERLRDALAFYARRSVDGGERARATLAKGATD